MENINATGTHLDFTSHGYHAHLSGPPASVEQPRHVPTEDELESYVPSLPTGWATGGQSSVQPPKRVVPVKKEVEDKPKKKTTRHRLPKDAVAGKPFTEDVSFAPVSVIRVLQADTW